MDAQNASGKGERGEKAFQCPRCGNKFTRKDVMIRHTTRKVCRPHRRPSSQPATPPSPARAHITRTDSPLAAFPAEPHSAGHSPPVGHRTDSAGMTPEDPKSPPPLAHPRDHDTRRSLTHFHHASPSSYRPSTPQGYGGGTSTSLSTPLHPITLHHPPPPPPLHWPDLAPSSSTNAALRSLFPMLREDFVARFDERAAFPAGSPAHAQEPTQPSMPQGVSPGATDMTTTTPLQLRERHRPAPALVPAPAPAPPLTPAAWTLPPLPNPDLDLDPSPPTATAATANANAAWRHHFPGRALREEFVAQIARVGERAEQGGPPPPHVPTHVPAIEWDRCQDAPAPTLALTLTHTPTQTQTPTPTPTHTRTPDFLEPPLYPPVPPRPRVLPFPPFSLG
ncbi:hypothetical protein M427DRAFT_159505 [Gonapodya prolifera JEL478]|uniref:C2H2-type domain-containing protein n=1 Tax=Gonapodya prolifera (strain JEL478) TaxID=1344416 RepID=A0A139A0M2_GONPJ|nr:hypothetical protein M427DRAFT_159505 [Gonapodya prolifera JEL478]|eukprot:KXS10320.1 hypothetical protein M427DRAFT_159505 [Gonapodya prolifera JEL478]